MYDSPLKSGYLIKTHTQKRYPGSGSLERKLCKRGVIIYIYICIFILHTDTYCMFFWNFPGAINDPPNGRCMTGCPTYFYMFIWSQKNKFQSQHPGQFVPRKSKHGHGNMAQMIEHHAGIVTYCDFRKTNHQFFLINFINLIPIHHGFVK